MKMRGKKHKIYGTILGHPLEEVRCWVEKPDQS